MGLQPLALLTQFHTRASTPSGALDRRDSAPLLCRSLALYRLEAMEYELFISGEELYEVVQDLILDTGLSGESGLKRNLRDLSLKCACAPFFPPEVSR